MLKRWMNFINNEEMSEILDEQEISSVRSILFSGIDEILNYGISEIKKQKIDLYKDMTKERYGAVLNPYKSLRFRSFADKKINTYISALLKYDFTGIKVKELKHNKNVILLISNKKKHVIDIKEIYNYMNDKLLKEFG